MTTKEYLNRAYELNKKINKNKVIINNLKSAAESTSSNFNQERVQTSAPTGSRMSALEDMAIDIENVVKEQEERLEVIRNEITSMINTVDDYEAKLVLKLRYLDYNSWEQIQSIMFSSRSSVFRAYHRGIDLLSQIGTA